ncbi:YkvA family protein [Parvularcula oceani]|uniref:YkvA family protein n=1 Tax=Parvularcula oceani TaxID=1247963 RepID=UPI00068EA9FB|nr:YkvA family protein [Parvularcula oceani]
MAWWRRRGGEARNEGERMAEEVEHPSPRHVARAERELSHAADMSEEEVEDAKEKIERDFLGKLVRMLSRLNRDVALRLLTGYYALRDPEVPLSAKAGFAVILLYFINPFDLIPDVTPVIGLLDDAGVLAGAWMYLGGHVTDEHRAKAEAYLKAQ